MSGHGDAHNPPHQAIIVRPRARGEIIMSSNFLNPVTTQTWANGRHLVRCVKVIQETWDVRTFCF
ncbi:TPA: hybrid-cluster NAD(P)-dependent oxidoreductase, partial [Pseudomonas aeruginosa]